MKKNSLRNIIFNNRLLLVALLLVFTQGTALSQQDDTDDTADGVIDTPPDETGQPDEENKKKRYFDLREYSDSFTVKERQLPASYKDQLKNDDDFWYAKKIPETKKEKQNDPQERNNVYVPVGERTWLQTLIWIIIVGGFAGAIRWYLADSNVGLFRKKNVTSDTGNIGEEEMPEDIFAINYQKEIDKAVGQGNYRLGVRLHFLQLLRMLADKNIIQYKQDRTNLDYLMQASSTRHYTSFFRLTRHFEFAWYGHFEVDEPAYRQIEEQFRQFEKEF